MFTKSRSQKNSHFLAALLAICSLSSIALATDSCEDEDLKWLEDNIKARPSFSNIVVLGPRNNGKSTLINMLIHTSEYATRAKTGHVLRDFEDRMKPIYHRDIFRFDINKPVNPRNFIDAKLPADLKDIPSIAAFMPILGPIPVKDFLKEPSEKSFGEEHESSGEKVDGGTGVPHVYKCLQKVTSPVFHSTFIDAPGIKDTGRLAFFKTVLEKSPSDEINAFLLVVSAEQLASKEFRSDSFEFFKEVAELLNQFDPTYTRVLLAVTHAGNKDFLTKVPSKDDPRRVASVAFKKATGMVISTSNIFFFENQYNCLSRTAIRALYDCHKGDVCDKATIQPAFTHRQKNYQLNVLESFNLLKTVARTKPALSRFEILQEATALEDREERDAKEQETKKQEEAKQQAIKDKQAAKLKAIKDAYKARG